MWLQGPGIKLRRLNCFRYPAETMKQVAELSKDVAADFRASREGKLKRTFVGADDAAAARYNNNRKK